MDIEEQTKATLQAAATIEAQRLIAASELELQRQILGAMNPETEYTRRKMAAMDSSLQMLIRPDAGETGRILVNLGEVPKFGLTYARLYRDIEIQQLIVAFLIQQYEQAKIEQARNTPTLVRIDAPVEATKRAWPRRGIMVIIAFAATFVFSSAVAMAIETLRTAATEPAHPQHTHLSKLLSAWKSKK